eukprot:m.64093 g.64093  ORF g.64093 m.64093 type:complete len:799 (+) comp23389_c0_seq1:489-2885(+)
MGDSPNLHDLEHSEHAIHQRVPQLLLRIVQRPMRERQRAFIEECLDSLFSYNMTDRYPHRTASSLISELHTALAECIKADMEFPSRYKSLLDEVNCLLPNDTVFADRTGVREQWQYEYSSFLTALENEKKSNSKDSKEKKSKEAEPMLLLFRCTIELKKVMDKKYLKQALILYEEEVANANKLTTWYMHNTYQILRLLVSELMTKSLTRLDVTDRLLRAFDQMSTEKLFIFNKPKIWEFRFIETNPHIPTIEDIKKKLDDFDGTFNLKLFVALQLQHRIQELQSSTPSSSTTPSPPRARSPSRTPATSLHPTPSPTPSPSSSPNVSPAPSRRLTPTLRELRVQLKDHCRENVTVRIRSHYGSSNDSLFVLFYHDFGATLNALAKHCRSEPGKFEYREGSNEAAEWDPRYEAAEWQEITEEQLAVAEKHFESLKPSEPEKCTFSRTINHFGVAYADENHHDITPWILFNIAQEVNRQRPNQDAAKITAAFHFYTVACETSDVKTSFIMLWNALETLMPPPMKASQVSESNQLPSVVTESKILDKVSNYVAKLVGMGAIGRRAASVLDYADVKITSSDDVIDLICKVIFDHEDGLDLSDQSCMPNMKHVAFRRLLDGLDHKLSDGKKQLDNENIRLDKLVAAILKATKESEQRTRLQVNRCYATRNIIVHGLNNDKTSPTQIYQLWHHLEWYVGKVLGTAWFAGKVPEVANTWFTLETALTKAKACIAEEAKKTFEKAESQKKEECAEKGCKNESEKKEENKKEKGLADFAKQMPREEKKARLKNILQKAGVGKHYPFCY